MVTTTRRSPRGPGGQRAPGRATAQIQFSEHDGVHSGTGGSNRMWRITACQTGWRLDFRDPGDMTHTYAGTHATLEAAMAEANR